MPLLNTKNTKATFTRARVDVPEFGTDENGEVYYVFARILSISERQNAVQGSRWVDRDAKQILFDYPQVAYFGAVGGKESDTDRGVRVFASVDFLKELPPEFEPAITRIALKVLALSGLISENRESRIENRENGAGDVFTVLPIIVETGDPVEEAKKD